MFTDQQKTIVLSLLRQELGHKYDLHYRMGHDQGKALSQLEEIIKVMDPSFSSLTYFNSLKG